MRRGGREAPGVVLIEKTTPSAPAVHPPLLGQGGESFPASGGLTPRRGRQNRGFSLVKVTSGRHHLNSPPQMRRGGAKRRGGADQENHPVCACGASTPPWSRTGGRVLRRGVVSSSWRTHSSPKPSEKVTSGWHHLNSPPQMRMARSAGVVPWSRRGVVSSSWRTHSSPKPSEKVPWHHQTPSSQGGSRFQLRTVANGGLRPTIPACLPVPAPS